MEFKDLAEISNVDLLENVNLERYTTMRLTGIGTIAICKSIEGLEQLLLQISEIPYHVIGWGANQVLENSGKALLIKLDFFFDRSILSKASSVYSLPASVPLNLLTSHAQKFGLKGWEVFTGVPASLGGAIYMNAGTALGEIGAIVKTVTLMKANGEIKVVKVNKNSFSYRKNHFVEAGEVIISAELTHFGEEKWISSKIKSYLEYRKSTQPLRARTCGSVFKNLGNEVRAGATIDSCGLKRFGYEHLYVSEKHANFIEHTEGGTAQDFKKLIECLKIDMERYSGHKFELEVKVY